jgi:cobalt-zinc-cadmium efflux system outer membrane protein
MFSIIGVKSIIAIALTLILYGTARAQIIPPTTPAASPGSSAATAFPGTNEITFSEFLNQVARANLDYAAQRYNVSIAQAAVAAAREFQNPTLQLNGGRDVTHSGSQQMPATYGASLTQTIELGGKRKYRIRGARQNYAAAAATLDDFLRNLKLDAAGAFADALALSRSAEEKRQSAGDLERLADKQRERFHAGDISHADLLQTQVEEQQFQNDLLASQADAENAALALNAFLGRDQARIVLIPKGNLEISAPAFDLSALLAGALQNRPDLVALRLTRDALQSNVRVEKANRVPDVDIGAGWTRSTSSQNIIAPSPEFDSIGLTLSLPLPLWNRNRAAISSARFSAEQAQSQIEAAELKAEVQIRQALSAYRGAVERVGRYRNGILKNAEAVLDSRRFSYQRGQTTLLELLDAQRTANEIRSGYNDALADQARALIDLQRAAGISGIEF